MSAKFYIAGLVAVLGVAAATIVVTSAHSIPKCSSTGERLSEETWMELTEAAWGKALEDNPDWAARMMSYSPVLKPGSVECCSGADQKAWNPERIDYDQYIFPVRGVTTRGDPVKATANATPCGTKFGFDPLIIKTRNR